MSDSGDPMEPAPGADDLGMPVSELRDLSWGDDARFGDKVTRRIERRLVVGDFLDLAWAAPWMMLLEFLRVPFDLLSGKRRP